jgi:hypothetical protein
LRRQLKFRETHKHTFFFRARSAAIDGIRPLADEMRTFAEK